MRKKENLASRKFSAYNASKELKAEFLQQACSAKEHAEKMVSYFLICCLSGNLSEYALAT